MLANIQIHLHLTMQLAKQQRRLLDFGGVVVLVIAFTVQQYQYQIIRMGNELSQFAYSPYLTVPENCKLYSLLPIGSQGEEQQMIEILQKRMKLSQCPYICTVRGYDFIHEESSSFTCSQDKKLAVYYDHFDHRLSEVPIKKYSDLFSQPQLCHLIRCISLALVYFKQHRLHHGDISLDNICRKDRAWKLIDKIFIKNGINAYEKVLEGQSGFISPKQMIRIRYGFVKESPQLVEADDVFALGMVVLQLASEVPSSLCYKEMNIRFNEEILNQNLYRCSKNYSREFCELVTAMINPEQDDRATLEDIMNNPLIGGKGEIKRNSSNGYQLNKMRVSELSNFNSRSSLAAMREEKGKKPLTPITTTMSSLAPTKQHSPITPGYNRNQNVSLKSSQYFLARPGVQVGNGQVGRAPPVHYEAPKSHRLKTIN